VAQCRLGFLNRVVGSIAGRFCAARASLPVVLQRLALFRSAVCAKPMRRLPVR
jgi:hypothetical protein